MPKVLKTASTAPAPAAAEVPKPFHRITFGLVRGSIWKGESNGRPALTLTLEQIVKATETSEEITQVFDASNLRNLVKVTSDCARWIEWQQGILDSQAKH
jgi:hypothetical protein